MPLPNVVIAGAPKCGTTSLFEYLNDHPEVCGASVKETYYLIDEGYPLFRKDANYHMHGLAGYERYFDKCNVTDARIYLEATPDYLYQETPLLVFPQMKDVPKILIMLRQPAQRIYSLYRFAQNNIGVLNARVSFVEFLEMVRSGDDMLEGRSILLNAFKHSRYEYYIRRWQEVLGREHIHVILFEQLVNAPHEFIGRVCEILQIDQQFYTSYDFTARNTTISVRNQFLHRIRKHLSGSQLPEYAKNIAGRSYRWLNLGKLSDISECDRKLIEELNQEFDEDNMALSELTGIDLTLWK